LTPRNFSAPREDTTRASCENGARSSRVPISAGNGLTEQGALEEIAALQKDKAFATRYLAGEAEAVRKFTRLHEVAFTE
jgi:hypothetical protein